MFFKITKLAYHIRRNHLFTQMKKCHSVFGIKEFIQQEKPNFAITQVSRRDHEMALNLIKQYYLSEHVLVQARNIDITNDQALDEYLIGLLKQGNSLYAKSLDGSVAGLCVNFASSPIDPKNLRNYAFYRQDPNIKDFLYFAAKMQETPNLWNLLNQQKVFEIKMLTVLPKFRRQGLAVLLTEKSIELANDQNYNVVRMDCINPHDYKIAERCMMDCIAKFPLHKIRGTNAPFIKSSSEYNVLARVYVTAQAAASTHVDVNFKNNITKLCNTELLIE